MWRSWRPVFSISLPQLADDDFVLFAQSFGEPSGKPASLQKPARDLNGDTGGTLDLVVSEGDDPGQRIVTVELKEAAEVQGYSLYITYDVRSLELVAVDGPTGLVFVGETGTEGVPLQVSPAPGEVVLADVLGPEWALSGDVDLARLAFRTLDEGTPGYVEIAEALVARGDGHIEAVGAARLDDLTPVPDEYALSQNYPNPFNPSTQIDYQLPEAGDVALEVYNVLGQRIRTLVRGVQEPGYHRVTWDGTDTHGRSVSSGVYFHHLATRTFMQTKVMILLK